METSGFLGLISKCGGMASAFSEISNIPCDNKALNFCGFYFLLYTARNDAGIFISGKTLSKPQLTVKIKILHLC
jgi:hypothetical protein